MNLVQRKVLGGSFYKLNKLVSFSYSKISEIHSNAMYLFCGGIKWKRKLL